MKILSYAITVISINLVKGLIINPRFHDNWHLVNPLNCGTQPHLQAKINTEDSTLTDYIPLDQFRRDAKQGEYPWVVLISIQIRGTPEKKAVKDNCMGSIITKRFILTASSCFTVYPVEPRSVKIRVGSVDTVTDTSCDSEEKCSPDKAVYHAESVVLYNTNSPAEDGENIALVKTSRDIIFNDNVLPICLEHGELLEQDYAGEEGVRVSGWGTNSEDGNYYSKLQHAAVPVFTQEENDKVYNHLPSTFTGVETYESYFCAGGPAGESQLDNDVGGPFVLKRLVPEDGPARYYLYGILSFKASIHFPSHGSVDVYTKVRNYFEWILDNIDA
uniref:Easter-6 n=1 Tax=Nilaparvata lugens TaxID=108931 RepID=A0A068F760_NILLU|nr:easter-6 [Nilaparvata lugens]APA33889.1 seminal fluid protein [Nilaparvata lugens]